MKEKILIILRGIPGSGKTTFANYLANLTDSNAFAADDYFYKNGKYMFNAGQLHMAHTMCQSNVRKAMKGNEHMITVHNTATTEKELKPYFDLANEFKYKVFSVIVENRHNHDNVHGVPKEHVLRMKNRFNIKL